MMSEEELARITVPFGAVSTQLRGVLDAHGAAIVTGVIPSQDELSALEAEFAEDLRELVDVEGVREAPPAVQEAYRRFLEHGPRAFPDLATRRLTLAAGFCVKRCLSQGRFAWRVRRHPNVQAVYRAIYPGSGALVSSTDVTFFTSAEQPPAESNEFSAHVDQNAHDVRPGLADWESYQGVLYVWPSGADGGSSTTVVWTGSHRTVWPEMMEDDSFVDSGSAGFHYSEIRDMGDTDAARRLAAGWACHARRAVVPAGGLFLWNSRTVHTGWRGGPRLAQTVCFEPASRRSRGERLAKLRLAALGLPSTHWASTGMQHDIVLGDEGYIANLTWDGDEEAESGTVTAAGVGLPLRPAIRPMPLAADADLQELADLVDVDYKFTGMWEAPEESAELLEASVGEEYKSML